MDDTCPRCKGLLSKKYDGLVPLTEGGYRVVVCPSCAKEYEEKRSHRYSEINLEEYWDGKLSKSYFKFLLAEQEEKLKSIGKKLSDAYQKETVTEKAFKEAEQAFIEARSKKLEARLTVSLYYEEHTKMQKYISDTEKLIASRSEEEC